MNITIIQLIGLIIGGYLVGCLFTYLLISISNDVERRNGVLESNLANFNWVYYSWLGFGIYLLGIIIVLIWMIGEKIYNNVRFKIKLPTGKPTLRRKSNRNSRSEQRDIRTAAEMVIDQIIINQQLHSNLPPLEKEDNTPRFLKKKK